MLDAAGRLIESCFPRFLPGEDEVQIDLGVTFDPLQGTWLAAFEDGVAREIFAEVDPQGGCVTSGFSFSLAALGDGYDTPGFCGGIEILDNTLLIGGRQSLAVYQVLMHPFTTPFRRGDANRDDSVDLSDAVLVANWLFGPPGSSLLCLDAADTNDDGVIDISDPVYLLFWLFRQGAAPPEPYQTEGADPTFRDNLGCEE